MTNRRTEPHFEFPEVISAAEVDRFVACGDNTHVIVWSLQHSNAVERLERCGKLSGDPRYVFADTHVGKKIAYQWMREMMAERLNDYHQEWPIWCSLTRPLMPAARPDDKLLRMKISKSRMLVSFYEGWVKLLGVMEHLGRMAIDGPSSGYVI